MEVPYEPHKWDIDTSILSNVTLGHGIVKGSLPKKKLDILWQSANFSGHLATLSYYDK